MGVNVEGGRGIFPTLCMEFCLVRLVLQDFALPGRFPCTLSITIFSLYFLVKLVIAACGSIIVQDKLNFSSYIVN